ncbi:MAG TPA: FAD binding domain-containing protein, partial [Acidobacteriota bacterium]|nr:FAD binding domain-containing protein [Acidobacteriota bacterium]
ATPDLVVNIKEIEELKGIEYSEGSGLRVGALVTIDELLQDSKVQQEYPSLIQAADGIRSAQIRSVGTVAGDLCQRPRCWYYRHGYGLLAMQNGSSMVVEGDNRYHAILGNGGPAYFVNPSSFAPALIALGAKLKVLGPNGEKEVAAADFFQTPQSESEKEYKLSDSEIVTQILVPAAAGKANATYEVREREALDWPLAAAAVSLSMQGDQVESAKVVLGHVAPVPWNSDEAAAALKGKAVSASVAEDAGKAAVQQAKALSRNKYKIQLARVAVKRAILRAAGMEV